jgi:hypothetical protein
MLQGGCLLPIRQYIGPRPHFQPLSDYPDRKRRLLLQLLLDLRELLKELDLGEALAVLVYGGYNERTHLHPQVLFALVVPERVPHIV